MIILKLLGALIVLIIGIVAFCVGCFSFMKSSEDITDGEAVFYCLAWVVGLFGGIILSISGLFLIGQAFS